MWGTDVEDLALLHVRAEVHEQVREPLNVAVHRQAMLAVARMAACGHCTGNRAVPALPRPP